MSQIILAVVLLGLMGPNQTPQVKLKISGICYGPYRDNETPHHGIFPLPSALESEIAFLSPWCKSIRTYSVANSHYLIPQICDKFKLASYPGAWLGPRGWQNDFEVELLIQLARQQHPSIQMVIVGNEVLHRGDLTEQQLIQYVQTVKKQVTVPVAVAETWLRWIEHPKLVPEVDVIMAQVYPYWDEKPIELAADYTLECIKKIQAKYPGKRVILSEFGWPTAGPDKGAAQASPENQARYLTEVLPMLDEKRIPYFYFSLWDENWKRVDEGEVGTHWGLFNADGTVKPQLRPLLSTDAVKGISRPARKINLSSQTEPPAPTPPDSEKQ